MLRRLIGDRRARRESEARYDAAMRAINEGVYDWNVADGTIFYSEAVYRVLGMPRSMRTPEDWTGRIHPEDIAKYNAAIAAHFKGATERFECEYRYRGPGGDWRWARQHGLAIRNAQGRAVRMVGSTGDVTDLKLAELELRDQMALSRALIEENPNAMYLKDTEGRYVTVNDAWLKMVGVTREQAIGHDVLELFPEKESERYHAEDMRLLRQGSGLSEVESLRTGPDGKPQWVIIRKAVLRRADGTITGLIGTNTDITARKKAEADLAAQDERLREQIALTQAIVAQAPNSIFAKDREGRFTLANRGWSEMSGLPAEKALGRTVHDLYPPESAQRFAAEDEKLLAQGASAPPVELLHTGPRPNQFRIVRKAVLSRDGEVLGLVCSSTDISEMKRMERELALERDRLELLVRATKAGFMDWDATLDMRTYSARFKEMLGYPPDADTSQWPSLFDMMHPEDRERMRDSFRDMLRKGAESGERMHGPLEYRLRKTDGSYVWVRGEGIAQIGADGRTERFLTSYIDITHLRELNLALEESVRLREEVDRISRHDLKTPLNSIVGIPRLLRDSGRLTAEDAELLAFVEQAGYRLLSMVNLSLDMFQMERGSYPFAPQAVDLRGVLGNVLRDVEHHARAKRLALRVEGPALHARAEELLCYSLFANLVKNAVEASPESGTITCSLAQSGESVLVQVHNAGAVPEAVRARFFEKYATAGKQGGSGLGTYSARLIARTQQGDITLESAEAAGTTLSVRLIRAAAAETGTSPAEEPAQQDPKTELRPLSVLVVDDDEYTRMFVQRFLPAAMRTRGAANGREAVDLVCEDPPDAIVMDLDMPVMGGLEAAALIRQAEAASGRPRCTLLAMSSHDDPDIAARCRQAGFDAYLAKPVSPEALRRALAAAAPAGEPVVVDAELKHALPGFLASRRELLEALARALAAGQAEPARALAHKLAGSLALYGFQWAAEQSKMIEQRAREGRLEGLAGEAAALSRYLDGVRVGFAAKGEAEAKA
jgi:PAS domain S-box-containing protein